MRGISLRSSFDTLSLILQLALEDLFEILK